MSDEESSEQGDLSGYSAQVLMCLLWLSRLSRPDLAFIVGRLASKMPVFGQGGMTDSC